MPVSRQMIAIMSVMALGIVVLASWRQDQPAKIQVVSDTVPGPSASVEKVNYRSFAVQCIVTALQGWTRGTMIGFLSLLATQVIGVSATKVGILFTISAIAIMAISISVGMLADWIGKKC